MTLGLRGPDSHLYDIYTSSLARLERENCFLTSMRKAVCLNCSRDSVSSRSRQRYNTFRSHRISYEPVFSRYSWEHNGDAASRTLANLVGLS